VSTLHSSQSVQFGSTPQLRRPQVKSSEEKKKHTARRHPYLSRAAGTGRGPVWDAASYRNLQVGCPYVCVSLAGGSSGALQKNRQATEVRDQLQLAATASAARGPEPSSWRSLGAPCSARRPPPPLDAPAPSIIERKFLTTRAGGGAAAACWSADASSDALSASFSCE
jgi:hypothetical protein